MATSWFADSSPSGAVCVYDRGQLLARIGSDVTVLKGTSGPATVAPCS